MKATNSRGLRVRIAVGLVLAGLALLPAAEAEAQDRGRDYTLSYSSGLNVSPAYEGWERDADGQRYFLFGYMNHNWEEEIVAPAGPDNAIEPGGPDRGQPTRFLPRRNRFMFRVPVPEGFSDTDEMVWTLTTNGVTEKAYATLRLDYFVDSMVRASEQGAIGAGTTNPVIRSNTAPTLTIEGATERQVRVGEPLTLVARATDDGIPESRRLRTSRRRGQSDRHESVASPLPRDREQRDRAAHVVVRLSGRRRGEVRPAAGHRLGGHAAGSALALVAALGDARAAAGQRLGRLGDVPGAGRLHAPLAGRATAHSTWTEM